MGLVNTEATELKDYKNLKVKTLVFHIFPVTNHISNDIIGKIYCSVFGTKSS